MPGLMHMLHMPHKMLCSQVTVLSAVASVVTICVAFGDALSAAHCTKSRSMSRKVIVAEWLRL